jgi:NhaP-type Na+/H+ or K+/H+ antiporter
LATGIIAVSLARHARLPGIVMLLGVGVLLGPDGANLVRPHDLGHALEILVEFAVAVILFEGGLNLQGRRLRRQARPIRSLVSIGAVITAIGGALAARWILGAEWRMSILFGTLVVVTGPTVITPLLRRIKVKRNLQTILEAEGVFIDAVGAILAVVALEVVMQPSGTSIALGFVSVVSRLLFGTIVGLIGGLIIGWLLRFRGVVPEGLENVFTLALALATFIVADTLMPESGIMAAIVAGLVVGNMQLTVLRELREFKEQLTVMLIGMLFVLLAADVRIDEVKAVGWPGLLVVLALMFIVRPINVWACTLRAGVNWREKAFLSWLAPRGIVAAAVSSFFYTRLSAEGIAGGAELRALVFLVIAVTVVVQGTTGAFVARWLGLRRPSNQGYVILGAHELGQTIAGVLQKAGEEVVLIDASAHVSQQAQDAGFRVVFGNAHEERVLLMAEVESRKGVLGTLPNEAVNLLFARTARHEHKVPKAYVAIQKDHGGINPDMVHQAGASVLFGHDTDLELWSVRLRRDLVRVEPWVFTQGTEAVEGVLGAKLDPPGEARNRLLPLVRHRGDVAVPFDDTSRIKSGDVVSWLVFVEAEKKARQWLEDAGWTPLAEASAPTA